MALGTVDDRGQPSVRIVLLKAFDERGFVFYTNYEGRKGRQLLSNPKAALCFYWPTIDIQVRIEGAVTKVAEKEADAYFATRHRLSQIGAWASRQSEPLETPTALDERVKKYESEFAGKDVPRPEYWSGFRVSPSESSSGKGSRIACTRDTCTRVMEPAGRSRRSIREHSPVPLERDMP